ncbi:MAG: phytoene desaturase family protein [Flavobacteriales bacterium]
MSKKVAVIGAGYSGLSAASSLAQKGYDVTLFEKNDQTGGRSRMLKQDGFLFDMGPSWYWMPDVFENYFAQFGKKVEDYYQLKRLDPSYQIYFGKDDVLKIPASIEELCTLFEEIEPGSSSRLKTFLAEAAYKYDVGINDLVHKPSLSWLEFVDMRIIKGVLKMHLFSSFSKYVRKHFSNRKLIQLLEFPVLFLGAKPEKTPALYSLMNYADLCLGTWYPMGGMNQIASGMTKLAEELGVKIRTNANVEKIIALNGLVSSITVNGVEHKTDLVVAAADYNHVEQKLLPEVQKDYTQKYWNKRVMAPSSLVYYVGVNKKLKNLLHHNLFFDEDFGLHAKEIYDNPQWPEKPLFYVSVTSVTDPSSAPEGCENLFILIPVAPGLEDTQAIRDHYYNLVINRLETLTEQRIRENVITKKDYAHKDFIQDYNSFKGNAYGLANTLKQTALLKPRMKSKKLNNLYYVGQLTTPGPGVPPALISGQVVAKLISKNHKN